MRLTDQHSSPFSGLLFLLLELHKHKLNCDSSTLGAKKSKEMYIYSWLQKERDLELAARIGQSLLKQNQELTERNEMLDEQLEIAKEEVWTVLMTHACGVKHVHLVCWASNHDLRPRLHNFAMSSQCETTSFSSTRVQRRSRTLRDPRRESTPEHTRVWMLSWTEIDK